MTRTFSGSRTYNLVAIVRHLIACLAWLLLAVACGTSSAASLQTHPSPSADPLKAFRAKLLSDAPGFLTGIGGCTHLQDPGGQNTTTETYCTNIVTSAVKSVEQLLTDLQPNAVPSALAPKADTVRSQLQAYLVILQKDQVAIAAGKWNDVIANQDAADQAGNVAQKSFDDLANCPGC